jgi:hypothetical protein
MHYPICIMQPINWEQRRDPQKLMHYEIYALLRYALWACALYVPYCELHGKAGPNEVRACPLWGHTVLFLHRIMQRPPLLVWVCFKDGSDTTKMLMPVWNIVAILGKVSKLGSAVLMRHAVVWEPSLLVTTGPSGRTKSSRKEKHLLLHNQFGHIFRTCILDVPECSCSPSVRAFELAQANHHKLLGCLRIKLFCHVNA